MKKREFETKKINLGIEILRAILCFWIVIIHCSIIKREHEKYFKKHFHVPTFIQLSFYFYFKAFSQRVRSKITIRFQRLLIPYILWPIIILILNNFIPPLMKLDGLVIKTLFNDLKIQLLIGSRIHGIFWYQFNLIFLSLFFTLISFISKIYIFELVIIIGFISYFFHISRLSYNFFIGFKGIYGMNMGCIIELIPMAVMGCVMSSFNVLSKKQYFHLYSHSIMSFIIFLLFRYDIFIYQPGFRYPNVSLNIFASTFLFLLFGTSNTELVLNEKFILIIRNITKFTAGIYYTHPLFRNKLIKYITLIQKKNYLSALIIYIIVFLIL